MIDSTNAAFELMRKLGAASHLLTHACLVTEAAELLLKEMQLLNIPVDANFVRIDVVLHDVGRVKHSQEMIRAGPDMNVRER